MEFTFSVLYWILMAAYAATVIGVIAMIVMENRNPVKSLAWVTVLISFPVIGLLIYLLFGRSFKNKLIVSRRLRRKLRRRERMASNETRALPHSAESRQQMRLAHSLCGAQLHCGSRVKLYTNGTDKFDDLLRDIAGAKSYILLQYYIFEDDRLGQKIAAALMERARSGIKVCIIYDHLGSFGVKSIFFNRMRQAGVEAMPFYRITFPPLGSRINWRNHRKIVVIDGITGYIGGMNIADRYIDGGRHYDMWRDSHLRITGSAVSALEFSFAVDWNFMGHQLPETFPAKPRQNEETGMVADVQLITAGPANRWDNIAQVFFKAIANAKRRVYIQTPYFLPTQSLLDALQAAALSGIDVRIMLPARTDSRLLMHASNSYIRECLQADIKIYKYNPGMLHSKVLIVDDELTSIGSTNFDFRSFEHNFESNLFLYSAEVNAEARRIFADDLKNCTRVMPQSWKRRPLTTKLAESLARLLSPIL